MTTEQALAFFIFSVVAAITPGPSNMILASAGATVGVIRGLPCLLGVELGMGLMMFLVALGLGRLVDENGNLLEIMRWSGACYLFWLAWKIASAGRSGTRSIGTVVGFRQAALFQWVTPKSWLVAASAAGTYLKGGDQDLIEESALLGGIFVAAAIPSCGVWLGFGAALQRLIRTERSVRTFNIVMGLSLAGSVGFFAL